MAFNEKTFRDKAGKEWRVEVKSAAVAIGAGPNYPQNRKDKIVFTCQTDHNEKRKYTLIRHGTLNEKTPEQLMKYLGRAKLCKDIP